PVSNWKEAGILECAHYQVRRLSGLGQIRAVYDRGQSGREPWAAHDGRSHAAGTAGRSLSTKGPQGDERRKSVYSVRRKERPENGDASTGRLHDDGLLLPRRGCFHATSTVQPLSSQWR